MLENALNAAPVAGNVLVGALEDSENLCARVLFHKNGGSWEAFPHDVPDETALEASVSLFPAHTTWRALFDGKDLGTFDAAISAKPSSYSRIGCQIPATKNPPVVGDPGMEFAGWIGTPVRRPLVLVSKPDSAIGASGKAAVHWKEEALPGELRKLCDSEYRNTYKRIAAESDAEAASSEIPAAIDGKSLHESSINQIGGKWIIQLKPDPTVCQCEAETCERCGALLFVIDSEKTCTSLGENLSYLDSGDFAGDGDDEVLFWIDSYNRNGYRMYFDGMKKSVDFDWSYH